MGGAALALTSCTQRSQSTAPEAPHPQASKPDSQEVETVSQAVTLAGFDDVAIMTGLTQPTVVKFAPNGKVFVGQKDGRIFVFDNVDDSTGTLFADLRTQVMNYWDRGLLGLAIDPNYPTTPNVYVAYTWDVDSLSGTAPRWNDACSDPTGAGCVTYARIARLTDMGNSGSTTSSLTPILSGWGQQFPSHSIGGLEFGPDGALYVSSGEGANFNAEDWGQWAGNPLGDPPGGSMTPPSARGGALRSQSLRRPSGDPILLSGTMLRLDKNTGAHMADNPLAGNTNANAKRIIASGLRNPYRFTIHPTTGELWIGDVGWGTYEEINRMGRGAPAENFGWPCWEGGPRQGGYDSANLTICEDLYATTQHVTPHYAYHHNNKIVTGETCSTGSSSIAGLAIYNGGNYPADYAGALFFADYTRKCIWVMRATNGTPDATRIGNFVTAAANPVDLQIGPGGDLYYVDLDGGSIRRVRYRVPNAVATANPTSGGVPLTVSFSGTMSTPYTPGATLTYAWDLDNDGAFDDGTASTASFTYNT
ncbi:MAG TPA: PQQ-dependent sugar dehydrogenase, partial [Polyangia bacterium]